MQQLCQHHREASIPKQQLGPITIQPKSVQKQILLQATICGESILKIMLQIALNRVPVPSCRLV